MLDLRMKLVYKSVGALQQEFTSPQGVMTLSEAKQVSTSLLRHSCLLLKSPTSALGSSCCTCSQRSNPIEQASGLAPNALQAQPSPNLPSEDSQLPSLAPLLPLPSSIQYSHVLKPGCG